MSEPKYVLHLPAASLRRGRTLERTLRRAMPSSRCVPRELVRAFEFRADEKQFAKELVRRWTNLWLFRSHQRRFCGDFVVVDMSSPIVDRRRAWVVDLKLGADLKLGGGGAGVQLKNAPRAVAEIADAGVVAPGTTPVRVVGDRRAVLAHFAA